MPTNVFFNHAVNTEQHLYEDIVVESLRMYGHECFYLPREVVEEDTILNEDVQSAFGDAYAVEMYIENTDGFEGEGDLMSKFGLSIRDTATFVISLRSWERFISLDSNLATSLRPNEGDLIHFPMSGSMFEIKFVEHENPFYQVGKLFVFKMQCELFEGIIIFAYMIAAGIDKIEDEDAYNIEMTMVAGGSGDYNVGENLTKSSVVVGEVLSWVGGNTRTLKVKDVTTTLVVGDVLVGAVTTAQYTVNSITDVLTMSNDALAQNLEFEATDSTYLDFSETNPFGEP